MTTLSTILNLLYLAMNVPFTVFGFEFSLWNFFVFSVVMSVIVFFVRKFFGGDD